MAEGFWFRDALLVILGASLVLLWFWRVPQSQAAERSGETSEQAKVRVERENAARTTLGQILTGIAAVVGLYFLWGQLVATNQTLRTTQTAQVAERFTRAIDQLGSPSEAIRLGGIYTLEQIARDPNSQWPVMEVLAAHLRAISPWPPREVVRGSPVAGSEEIRSVVAVIARRGDKVADEDEVLNLRSIDLRFAPFGGAYLRRADFRGSNLHGAKLFGADLREADFRSYGDVVAILSGAELIDAELQRAWFICADLGGNDTRLVDANLREANFTGARLEGANLADAHLQGAVLAGANLRGAVLSGAELDGTDLTGAFLQGADLTEAEGLTQSQLDLACIDGGTKLPGGVRAGPGMPQCKGEPPSTCEAGSSAGPDPEPVAPRMPVDEHL